MNSLTFNCAEKHTNYGYYLHSIFSQGQICARLIARFNKILLDRCDNKHLKWIFSSKIKLYKAE